MKEFVFFYENGKKYLLLKWCNRRGETLDGMRMTITFRDAAGAEIGKEAHSFDGLCAAANADFLLPKIEVSEDCVDFKADLKSARYGRYLYSAVEGGVAAEYVSSLQAGRTAPPSARSIPKNSTRASEGPLIPSGSVCFSAFCSRRS